MTSWAISDHFLTWIPQLDGVECAVLRVRDKAQRREIVILFQGVATHSLVLVKSCNPHRSGNTQKVRVEITVKVRIFTMLTSELAINWRNPGLMTMLEHGLN